MFNRTDIIIKTFKDEIKIQNYANADKEENNKIIQKFYHTSTDSVNNFPKNNSTIF